MKSEFKKRLLSALVILPISFFFIYDGSLLFELFLIILFLITSYEWTNMNRERKINIFLGIIFLFFSFYTTFLLRNYDGLNFFLFIILICISTDIGGYIFGKLLKGPKLTRISPNKTYSGLFGSLILSITTGFVYILYIPLSLKKTQLNFIDFNNFNIYSLISFIVIISILSQLGDIIISYFKRLAKIKDTGKLIPGHGGILDRIDGLIFVIPILYLFLTF